MKHHLALPTSAATLIFTIATAQADSSGFQGFYAPDTWTVSRISGGASAIFAADGSELTITGADGGFASDIDVTHVVLTDGNWSFQWSYYSFDERNFDVSYYLLNGSAVYLSPGGTPSFPTIGSISVPVQAGDVIGWRVESVDGIFGAGVLTITDFRAPVPVPAALALLGLAGSITRRRRGSVPRFL